MSSECGSHQTPSGPNEDVGMCGRCGFPMGVLRPEGESFGLHLDDCSLPERHRGECVGGGTGHPPARVIRGWWPGMEDDIDAAGRAHNPRTADRRARQDESEGAL